MANKTDRTDDLEFPAWGYLAIGVGGAIAIAATLGWFSGHFFFVSFGAG